MVKHELESVDCVLVDRDGDERLSSRNPKGVHSNMGKGNLADVLVHELHNSGLGEKAHNITVLSRGCRKIREFLQQPC